MVGKGTKLGRFGDGCGLYLLVRSREAKSWLFRYTGEGKMKEMGLGPATGRAAVKLDAARAKARELHDAVREGRDPLAERKAAKAKAKVDAAKAQAGAITFVQVADMYIAAHEASWRNPKHRQQWRNTLNHYVRPVLGALPVDSVDTGVVVKILEPLWREKTETASRVRGRIEAVLDYAKARGWRTAENPARWRGHLDQLLPKRNKVHRAEHHAALSWREIGTFMQRLREGRPRAPGAAIRARHGRAARDGAAWWRGVRVFRPQGRIGAERQGVDGGAGCSRCAESTNHPRELAEAARWRMC
jgi:hypothetical protein